MSNVKYIETFLTSKFREYTNQVAKTLSLLGHVRNNYDSPAACPTVTLQRYLRPQQSLLDCRSSQRGRAGLGRAGQRRAGQGRAGDGRAGQETTA